MNLNIETLLAIAEQDGEDTKPNILIVDDDPTNIHVIHQILGNNYKLRMAKSGAQALDLCLQEQPDIALLDFDMPEMSGLEVCQQLKRNPVTEEILVIFVTAHTDHEIENQCWKAGAIDFVSKPVNPVTLLNRVNSQLTLKQQAKKLKKMAFIDSLTGAFNRRVFNEVLHREWSRSQRQKKPMGLLMIDIDHFKAFNDTHGHLAGDQCLKVVAGAIKRCCKRSSDFVARYGGEEFCCLLPDTALTDIKDIAEQVRESIEKLSILLEGESNSEQQSSFEHVTVSIGAATTYPNQISKPEQLIINADEMLYKAKDQGRNRAICEQF